MSYEQGILDALMAARLFLRSQPDGRVTSADKGIKMFPATTPAKPAPTF